MSTYPKTALVINCGSSSVKFAILDPKDGHVFLNGIAEALGLADARISWKFNGGEKTETQLGAGADHSKALEFLVKNVLAKDEALHDSIVACGHRIVQGGDIYSQPTLIDDEVEENIKKVIPFDYNKMQMAIVQMEEKGLNAEQAMIEAFYAVTRA